MFNKLNILLIMYIENFIDKQYLIETILGSENLNTISKVRSTKTFALLFNIFCFFKAITYVLT